MHIAQAALDTSALIARWQWIAAAVLPLAFGLITSDKTRSVIKMVLPVVGAVAVSAVAFFSQHLTFDELIIQAPILLATIEGSYRLWSAVVAGVTGSEKTINGVLMPTKGLIR
jgi:hypothetical protein